MFARNCPKCEKELMYSHKCSLNRANKKNMVCQSCVHLGKKQSIETIEKRMNKIRGTKQSIETIEKRRKKLIGKKRSEESRKNISEGHKGISCEFRKGKTWEEIYGEKKAKELRNKWSKIHKGKEAWNKGNVGIEFTDEHKKNMRISAIKRIERNVGQCVPNYNPIACIYFEKLMKENNIFIQHAQNGGEFHIKELGYWVDGYDESNNIVYEYDESHHFKNGKLKEKDVKRQKEIEEFLECQFLRIKE